MGIMSSPNVAPLPAPVRGVGWIALLAAGMTAGLMVYGGWVRASGSGLGCPDWPLCQGVLVPELEGSAAIEFGHRLFAGITILTVAIATTLSYRARRDNPAAYRLLACALAVILIQAVIGGVTVLTKLHGTVVIAHLGLAMATLALLTFGGLSALRPHLAGRHQLTVGNCAAPHGRRAYAARRSPGRDWLRRRLPSHPILRPPYRLLAHGPPPLPPDGNGAALANPGSRGSLASAAQGRPSAHCPQPQHGHARRRSGAGRPAQRLERPPRSPPRTPSGVGHPGLVGPSFILGSDAPGQATVARLALLFVLILVLGQDIGKGHAIVLEVRKRLIRPLTAGQGHSVHRLARPLLNPFVLCPYHTVF